MPRQDTGVHDEYAIAQTQRRGCGRRRSIQWNLLCADRQPGQTPDGKLAASETPGHAQGRLGLAVRPLTREERDSIGAQGGVLVESVAGSAARAGIQSGDVVLAINGTTVTSGARYSGERSRAGCFGASPGIEFERWFKF